MNKAVERVRSARKLPRRYGVVDERLVSDGYLKRLPAEAVSLYVFLCVVGNREGRSWYSDGRIVQMVRLSSLAGARRQLIEAGLISWEPPVYTVVDVPQPEVNGDCVRSVVTTGDSSEPVATKAQAAAAADAIRRKMGWG